MPQVLQVLEMDTLNNAAGVPKVNEQNVNWTK